MSERMNKGTFERCFVAVCHGMVAQMLLDRGTQPTEEEMDLLNDPDITIREFVDLATACGKGIELTLRVLTDERSEK